MYNKLIMAGNLTRDVEIKYTQSGSPIANTAIATSRKFKAQDGSQKEEVCFIDIAFFGRTAEIANQYLKKGSKILVDGRLKFDQWTSPDGTKRSRHSLVVESLQMLGNGAGTGGGEVHETNGENMGTGEHSQYSDAGTYAPPSPSGEPQPTPERRRERQVPSELPVIDITEDDIHNRFNQ